MANLQESARQLVEQIGELDADLTGATGRLTQMRAQLKAAEKGLDERIEQLEKEVGEFVTLVGEETRQLDTALDEADQAMTQAQQAVEGARTAAESAIESGQQQAQAVANAVEEVPDALERMVAAQAEEVAATLGEQARAASTAVEQAVDLASDNVRSFTGSLVELQQKLPDAADGMGEAIKLADKHIGEAFVEWTGKLFEVVDLVKNEGFEPAQENAEEVAGYALDQCREGLDEAMQAAFDRVAELAREFEALQQAIGQEASQVTEGGQPLVSELGEVREALAAAINWLHAVEEQFGGYTFMKA